MASDFSALTEYVASQIAHRKEQEILDQMGISPDKAVSITVEQIDNGYILAYGSTAGAVIRKFYCESEVAIGEKIIALAGRKKLQGDDAQLELPLDANAGLSAITAADAAYYAQKSGEHK